MVRMFRTSQILTLLVVSAVVGAYAAGFEQGENTKGKKRMGRPVVHFEIGCRDNAKTRDFYANLFDWQMTAAGPASMIQTEAGKGIDGHITSLGHEPHNYVTFYVEVEDIQSYLDKAAKLGGKTVVPPVTIPTGKFAWFSDPEGNIIGLLQPKKP